MFGNKYVCDEYSLLPEYHALDEPTMKMAGVSANLYGINGFEESPRASVNLKENDTIDLDGNPFEIRFVPGHAPGHVAFINHDQKTIIGGDVLFHGSIGRTDLPGGDFDTLIASIRNQFFNLADDFKVYSGHGEETTIGHEKRTNPFLT